MSVDAILALASTIQSSKGAYAVLAGSGVSRSSGILTGHGVQMDLIRRVAVAKNEDCEPDPEKWFSETFGSEPTYSLLLAELAGSDAERSQLLTGYFVPTEEDSERGLKRPTKAHEAIASLMERGFLRVIITTNFDRLFEQALEARGVHPVVISTAGQIAGMLPLMHQKHLVLKVHGDYLDRRIRNTAEELGTFEPELNCLLDRILNECGLIVCGWSGEWDVALREAIERCRSRVFSTYWSSIGEPVEAARRLISHRGARGIAIACADQFFHDLHEKVVALEARSIATPVSLDVMVERLKRYLSDDKYRIDRTDLIRSEVSRVMALLAEVDAETQKQPTVESVARQLQLYEHAVWPMLHLLAAGSFYGELRHASLWKDVVERIASRSQDFTPYTEWDDVRRYPEVLLSYAIGVGAVAAGQFGVFSAVIVGARFADRNGVEYPAIRDVNPWAIDGGKLGKVPNAPRIATVRFGVHVHQVLGEVFSAIGVRGTEYERSYDRAEAYLSLMFSDAVMTDTYPLGHFALSDIDHSGLIAQLEREVEEQRTEWPLVKSGFFDHDFVKAKAALAVLKDRVARVRFGG